MSRGIDGENHRGIPRGIPGEVSGATSEGISRKMRTCIPIKVIERILEENPSGIS